MDSRIYILTHKQLTGQLSSAEHDEFRMLSLNPEHKALSEEIAYLWNVSNSYFPTKDWQKASAKQAFYDKIRKPEVKTKPVSDIRTPMLSWQRVLGAAALILLIGWIAFSLINRTKQIEAVDQIEYAEIMDDTRVWLDKGATLTVIKESASERKVALVGEAFFDVRHNPSRPFTIDLGNEIMAEVLGTSFKARSTHEGLTGKISVREGQVRLYSTSDDNYEMILSSNEEGELDPRKEVNRKTQTTRINALNVQSGQLTFDDTPLDKVLDKLGLHFGVRFEYDRNVISKCRYSAGVPERASIHETLDALLVAHEGLTVTSKERSTYSIGGSCN